MRGRRIIAVWLMVCLLLAAGSACAQSSYQTLCSQNGVTSPDAGAWLEIPSVGLTLPVMQHPQDDAFYASHDARGNESPTGTLYTQPTYNRADFSDPVTIVYGSSANEYAPYGRLQEWYSGSFDKCRTIYLHLPQETREYTVFAALPYSSIHILHYYDFSVARRYDSFFSTVFSTRALGMHLDESNKPAHGTGHVLILSASLRGDKSQRYLVMAGQVTSR